ncbi:MAG TPA: pyridoxamine 5'-phosphate oxidase [Acidimicrobiia bacterium]|nr:pyridoxamine 5'-phosphate oxidase [Acidimicrobiia bacterium]
MAGLQEDDVDPDPLAQFVAWYEEAGTDAVAVATASAEGEPSVRMVLLKGVDQHGFAFYTNYDSAKARDLAANPRAALCFFWPPDRQVRVSGPVEVIEPEESARYWRNRPRASQLSAWASRQSQVVESREALEQRVAELEARFGDGEVPPPPFWGGYRLVPEVIEFWHHREDRLHDRIRYRRESEGWAIERLAP